MLQRFALYVAAMSQTGNFLAKGASAPYERLVLHPERFRLSPARLVKNESFAGKAMGFSSGLAESPFGARLSASIAALSPGASWAAG
jgi:hypothetical protein